MVWNVWLRHLHLKNVSSVVIVEEQDSLDNLRLMFNNVEHIGYEIYEQRMADEVATQEAIERHGTPPKSKFFQGICNAHKEFDGEGCMLPPDHEGIHKNKLAAENDRARASQHYPAKESLNL